MKKLIHSDLGSLALSSSLSTIGTTSYQTKTSNLDSTSSFATDSITIANQTATSTIQSILSTTKTNKMTEISSGLTEAQTSNELTYEKNKSTISFFSVSYTNTTANVNVQNSTSINTLTIQASTFSSTKLTDLESSTFLVSSTQQIVQISSSTHMPASETNNDSTISDLNDTTTNISISKWCCVQSHSINARIKKMI